MAQRRAGGEGASTSGASALAPTNMLFMDEQYVVSLFQACLPLLHAPADLDSCDCLCMHAIAH